jgi:hypothetical protein
MNTPGQGVAGIGGTGVVVITVHWDTDTVAISIADVEFCTRIAVVARRSWHSGAGSSCAGGIRSAIRIGAVDEIIPIVVDAVVADFGPVDLNRARDRNAGENGDRCNGKPIYTSRQAGYQANRNRRA